MVSLPCVPALQAQRRRWLAEPAAPMIGTDYLLLLAINGVSVIDLLADQGKWFR
jgi:hypothetical protein